MGWSSYTVQVPPAVVAGKWVDEGSRNELGQRLVSWLVSVTTFLFMSVCVKSEDGDSLAETSFRVVTPQPLWTPQWSVSPLHKYGGRGTRTVIKVGIGPSVDAEDPNNLSLCAFSDVCIIHEVFINKG